jgi:MOSC domain-containing protein YiiM
MMVISFKFRLPRTVQWKGKAVSVGMFKTLVSGRIHLRTLNFGGDRQADLSLHGGLRSSGGAVRLSARRANLLRHSRAVASRPMHV